MRDFSLMPPGAERLIATKRREKTMIADYGRIGIYNYFADLPPHDDQDPDYITMYLMPADSGGIAGWVWLIPLRDGTTSVGIVYRDPPQGVSAPGTSKQEAMFWQTVKTMPRLERRLRAARATDTFRAISDYSFTVARKFGPDVGTPRWAGRHRRCRRLS